jgi:hypothetical protein
MKGRQPRRVGAYRATVAAGDGSQSRRRFPGRPEGPRTMIVCHHLVHNEVVTHNEVSCAWRNQ